MTSVPAPSLSIQLQNFSATPRSDWSPMLDLARAADRAGIDRVVVSDHVVFGEQMEAYANPATGGTEGGRQPTGPDGLWLEPLTVLTAIAATTSQVRLATGILIAALRRPAVLAKQVATLDVLSGGRVDLGVGVGWQREEYEACGLDFDRRGKLLDQTIEVCRRLWSEQAVDFDDGDLRFERIHAMPEPVQEGGVPIWVAGRINAPTLRRLRTYGSGWIPWGEHVADPAEGIVAARRAVEDGGRDPASLEVQGTLVVASDDGGIDLVATMARVPELIDMGVTDFRIRHRWSNDLSRDEAALTELAAAFRTTTG